MQETARERTARRQAERAARNHKKNKRAKRFRIGCSVFMLIFLLVFVAVFVRNCQVNERTRNIESENKPAITVEVPTGAGASDIGKILEEKKVIKSASKFTWYCKFKGLGADFKAGTHNFVEKMTYAEVAKELQEGGTGKGVIKILIPEGATIDQMGEIIAKKTHRDKKDFIKAVNDPKSLERLKEKYPVLLEEAFKAQGVKYVLEGYLFPATYDYRQSDDLTVLVAQMVAKSDEVLRAYQKEIKSGQNLQTVLTMASLVEKEGVTTEDRKKIASVFYNRLKQDMLIQSDISVLYALGTHKELVTYKDLEIDSPYNLYKYKGLGPGPMNSPSQDAIEASMHPADTDYLYFFANLKTGQVYFTADFDEHLRWQEEYKKTGKVSG